MADPSMNVYMRARVILFYKKRMGIELPPLELYAHRHVIGEFLNRHVPGGKLKTWYLTHSPGKGSDNEYGDDDAAFLRRCISEVLEGVPPLHEQERQRLEEAERRERERAEHEQRVLQAQERTAAELAKLRAQLEAKDKELDQLRARAADRSTRPTLGDETH